MNEIGVMDRAPTVKQYRLVLTVDVDAESKSSAAGFARIIALRLRSFKHPSLPTMKAWGSDVVEVREL